MARGRSVARWVGGGALLAALALGLVAAFWPRPLPVDVVAVERGPLTVTVDGEGETRVKDVYVVTAPVSGRVMRIEADPGDLVRARETVLATVLPTDPAFLDVRTRAQRESDVQRAQAALALAQAELDRSGAALNYARSELERVSHLAEQGNVSRARLDQAQMEVRTRQAEVASREAEIAVRGSELEAARAALIEPGARIDGGAAGEDGTAGSCCVQVRSPHDGVVLRVLRRSEGVVAAGEQLVEVGDPRDLEVVVDLLSTDAVRVRPGAEVSIEDWGGGDALAGEVRRVEPFGFTKVSALGIEEQRVNVLIDLTSPPEDWAALGHGYRVMARIVVWQGTDVVSVPIGAVFRPAAGATGAGDWAVFVVEDGRARLRPVTLGAFTDRAVEVTAGLEPGEVVLLHPSDRIEDGTRVEPRVLG